MKNDIKELKKLHNEAMTAAYNLSRQAEQLQSLVDRLINRTGENILIEPDHLHYRVILPDGGTHPVSFVCADVEKLEGLLRYAGIEYKALELVQGSIRKDRPFMRPPGA